jgi:signal recognition particle receptor subunit alpha
MASLDFSSDKIDAGLTDSAVNMDISSLVDKASLGSRTQDGLYEVKDWDFGKSGESDDMDDVISQALNSTSLNESTQTASTSLGSSLGSLFARLTGSKTLTEQDLNPVLEGMKQHLMKKNVAKEIAEKVCEGVGEGLIGKKVGGFQSESYRMLSWLFLLNTQQLQTPPSVLRCPIR